jgi:hypothetical protein
VDVILQGQEVIFEMKSMLLLTRSSLAFLDEACKPSIMVF